MARPKKYINKKQFESLCAIQCTKEEICDVLDVTEKTLNNWCKEIYGTSFSLVFNQKRALGKASLRRNQWKLAEKGNSTMQIWLGKQILKQSENPLLDEIRLKEMELREREFALKEKSIELEQSRIEKLTNNPFKDLTIEQLMELSRIDDEK